ncbi:DUF4450 domain-containing protein [Belliella marina]|uniref:DUF4450 domain-containing protein n=1 Tax=Belliella marina TaxID=1644146 RepID=A0ABW4VP24_9BACT
MILRLLSRIIFVWTTPLTSSQKMKLAKSNSIIHLPLRTLFWIFLPSLLIFSSLENAQIVAQQNAGRTLRYFPDQKDFVIKNGNRRFNRALYGYPSDYRVEAGDLPEFAFYLPGMGGNLSLALIGPDGEKWLIRASDIEARYRPGKMLYTIQDPMLGDGRIFLEMIPLREVEGAVLKIEFERMPEEVDLLVFMGGVSGKKFSRSGDLGADPESVFYLHPENCTGNTVNIAENQHFSIAYGSPNAQKEVLGTFSEGIALKVIDAGTLESPVDMWESLPKNKPLLAGRVSDTSTPVYLGIYQPGFSEIEPNSLPRLFLNAEVQRKDLTNRIKVNTPDPFINTIDGALAVAGNAIFDEKVSAFVHGAVAWRMPLPGWRGAYVADGLGWHDRARRHFDGYLASQYLEPDGSRNDPDPEKNLGRQIEKTGYSIYNSGYLSRRPGPPSPPHHYDMNQVFFDQLIRHFDWTGDLDYLEKVWPNIVRHLDWEKRNFDPDGDGLYNAFASIWASDALQYNGGGVAHASAYNYYAFKNAARLGLLIGKEVGHLQEEAAKIKQAMERELWQNDKGVYAEYKDLLGGKRIHPQAGIWSVYHVLDSEVPDPIQSFLMTQYVDLEIPHIPIGFQENNVDYQVVATTNWMPYTWSVNNVALAETLHTALAYWQANNKEGAYQLWKSALLESMYMGGSPGNFQQLSTLDAMRGELYRDFADPIGMASRSLIEGLFGINPDLTNSKIHVQPGFPVDWEFAHLEIPDFTFDFQKTGNVDQYTFSSNFSKAVNIKLLVQAKSELLKALDSNGTALGFSPVDGVVGYPQYEVDVPLDEESTISLTWSGEDIPTEKSEIRAVAGKPLIHNIDGVELLEVNDPQQILGSSKLEGNTLQANTLDKEGNFTIFLKLKKGKLEWWHPIALELVAPITVHVSEIQQKNRIHFGVETNIGDLSALTLKINGKQEEAFSLEEGYELIFDLGLEEYYLYPGTNKLEILAGNELLYTAEIINWDIQVQELGEPIALSTHFNDAVTQIFENEYLSPRSPYPTLQIPKQGLGDWASFGAYMKIDDQGVRDLASQNNGVIHMPFGLGFALNPDEKSNIAFTSFWDNYPDSLSIPISGKASHAYFLMAGTTNHMQSRIDNGYLEVVYQDGSIEKLAIHNPENWWPIEQDYYLDGLAFDTNRPRPYRVHLATGKISNLPHDKYTNIGHFTKYAIEGGAATVLDLPLDATKELKEIRLKTVSVDVVIGLMAVTLVN